MPLFHAAYRATVAVELAVARLIRSRAPVAPVAPASLTAVVKTFERPAVLGRMLASLRRVYAGKVLVADDSRDPVVLQDPLVEVLRLPFDSGVGAGRNALIDAVATEYLWMADDDMVVLPDLDVGRIVAWLDRHPEVDLVGGRVVNLPTGRTADYAAAALYAYRGRPRIREGALIDGLPVRYKVPNFYVARTASVRGVRYDDALKRVDHNDFFSSAYGRLVCVQDTDLVCLHAHAYFDTHYQAFRMDKAADVAHLGRKWGQAVGTASGVAGRAASGGATGSPGIPDSVLLVLHHAALQVVADDLGVRIVHRDAGPDGTPRVGASAGGVRRLVDALKQLGWSGAAHRLEHPLWGRAAVESIPTVEGVSAEFAGIIGEATRPGVWPVRIRARGQAPPATPQPTRDGAEAAVAVAAGGELRIRRSPRVGWVDEGDALSAATLPLGPVVRITPPGDAIWHSLGDEGHRLDDVVDAVLDAHPDAPPEAGDQIRDFIADLVARGLLEEV